MYAAVVTSFDAPPAYLEVPSPVPAGSDQVLVDVIASGLHRRVRSQADGSHYYRKSINETGRQQRKPLPPRLSHVLACRLLTSLCCLLRGARGGCLSFFLGQLALGR